MSADRPNIIARAASLAWRPPDTRPPWKWAEEHYEVPVSNIPGKWRSENSPWVRKLMEEFADNSVRQITVMCSAQSSKTETGMILANWIVAEDPSPAMWIAASDEEGLKFANERLMPAFHMCQPVKRQIPDSRTLAKSMEIYFPTMLFEIVGSNSKAKLQSRSRRYLLCDEVRNWPKWALPMAKMRVRTWWNSRILILSTPGDEKDVLHNEWLAGSQEHWHVPCLNPAGCDYRGPLEWENVRAEHPQTRKCVKFRDVPGVVDEDGRWDFDALAPHIRYVCPRCGYMQRDEPQARWRIMSEGVWVSHNPKAPKELKSYTWNALLPFWVKWRDLVQKYVMAQVDLDHGNHDPMKTFVTESLGRPWEDRLRFAVSEGYIDDRVSDFTAPFNEVRRFLSIDVQGKGGRHFYWSVHAFAPGGAQRVLAWGKAWSVEELRSLAATYAVPAQNIVIDSGHWASEVYGYVMESGVLPDGNYAWKAMKGDKAPFYRLGELRLPYTWTFVDPFLGTNQANRVRPIRQLLFSKSSMLDRAEACMRGIGPSLELPNDGDMLHEYKMQLTAYERMERIKANGVVEVEWTQKRPDDHWGSCFRQALVAAMATGLMDVVNEPQQNAIKS
ncbi:bacteriophage tail assembly protein [Opitutaceae bacterium TAV1]|nr:bacteriophage tail assembly protein [Opitutaceae bacterium TAV1]